MKSTRDKGPAIIIGPQHINTVGLIRSVGEANYSPVIYIDNSETEYKYGFATKSKYIDRIYKANGDQKVIKVLRSLSEQILFKDAPILTMSDKDADFVDRHFDELSKSFICANINTQQGEVSRMLDKEEMRKHALKSGINVPSSWILTLENIDSLPNGITYPCIIKPISSPKGRKDFGIYENEESLKSGLKELFKETDTIQIQEYIKKDFEFIVNGISNGKEYYCLPAIRKIRQYPYDNGGFAYGQFTDTSKLIDINKIDKFLKSLKYNGIFSIEFIVKDGKEYFLEINLRNDATSYLCTASGVNLPDLWIRSNKEKNIVWPKSPKENRYVCNVIRDAHNVIQKKVSLLRWIGDMVKSKADSFLNFRDVKPILFYFINHRMN